MNWVRPAVVAGRFYPADARRLRSELEEYCPPTKKQKAIAVMAPHAGYVYSGSSAGKVFSQVEIPELVFILSPNHTGRGRRVAIWSEGAWDTPLGRVPVDEKTSEVLLKEWREKDGDMLAHAFEHAVEVEIPFLQYLRPTVRIVPVVLGHMPLEKCLELGMGLARVVEAYGKDRCLLVASSDMSHYIPAAEAKRRDQFALDAFESLDAKALYTAVAEHEISMCGFIPTTVVLSASKALGATSSKVVSYTHSGQVTGDEKSVVAYASGVITQA